MKTWALGALAGACVGVVIYLVLAKKPAPPAETRIEAPPTAPSTAARTPQAQPLVLSAVVEVTDIDHLLDPPTKDDTGLPFDEPPATIPVSAPAGVNRIPPAADGPELAPMPRAITRHFGLSFDF
jgi:hypothetical protein